MLDTQSL